MKLTAQCYYAIIASAELARYHGLGPVKSSVISDKHGIPSRFLELTLNELKNAGIVDSRRGAEGGFYLKESPDKLTAYDIVRAIDGDVEVVECSRFAQGSTCTLESYMRGLDNAITKYLKANSLRDLADMIERQNPVINYSI